MTLIPDFMPVLGAGAHSSPAKGACAMEYASILAGEAFSDRPQCADDGLSVLVRAVNDSLGDASRQRLIPVIVRVIGTNLHDAEEEKRVWDTLADTFFRGQYLFKGRTWRQQFFSPISGVLDWVIGANDSVVALAEVFDAFDELTGHKPQENVDLTALEQRRRELANAA